MDSLQIVRQVKYQLEQQAYAEGDARNVFASGSVRVVAEVPEEIMAETRGPFGFVVYTAGNNDPEHDEIKEASVTVTVVVCHFGDMFGEDAVIGGLASPTSGNSASKGVLEVGRHVRSALRNLDTADGIQTLSLISSDAQVALIDGNRSAARQDHTLTVYHEDVDSYPSVERFAGSAAGGTATLTWTDPGTRYDSNDIEIRRVSGSVASFVRTSGTLVGNIALGTQTTTDSPASATYTYGAWGTFDENGDGTEERYSSRDGTDEGRFVTLAV